MPRQKKKYTRSTTHEINVLTKTEKGSGDEKLATSSSSLSAQNAILEESEELETIGDHRPDFHGNGNQGNKTGLVSSVTCGDSAFLSSSSTAEAVDISFSSVRMNGNIPNTGVLGSCSRLEQSQSETRVSESVSHATTNERSVFGARTSAHSSSRPSPEAVANDQASVSELHTSSSSSFAQRSSSSKVTSTQNTLRTMTVHQGYDDDLPGNRNGSQNKTQQNALTSDETTREMSDERMESSPKTKPATGSVGTGTSAHSSSRLSPEAVSNDQASASELHTSSSSSFAQRSRSSKANSTQNTLRTTTVHPGYDDDIPGSGNGSQNKTQQIAPTSDETTREMSEERMESSPKTIPATGSVGTGARTSAHSSSRPSPEAVSNDQASISELHTSNSSSFAQRSRSSKANSTQNTHPGYDDDIPGNRNGSQKKTQQNALTSDETTREMSEERIESSPKTKPATGSVGTGEMRGLMKKVLTLQYAAYSISNIRKWLQRMEVEVPSSLDYHDCNQYEKSVKLKHQKELYDEIKRYTDHVCHTFNLCRVLMQDKEVCRTEDQYNSLKNLVAELEPKWTYICGLFTILSQKFETEPITPVSAAAAAAPPSDSDSPEGCSPCCKLCAFLLPIYLLLLLLLFIAFIIIPAWCECENSWCYYKNSYRNSFNLMLDYPSGSPPV